MEPLCLNNFQLVQGHIRNAVCLTLRCLLLHALLLHLINLRIAIIPMFLHVHMCGSIRAMKPIAVVHRMLKWKWMIHWTFRRLLLANTNVNETENEKGIRNGNVELRSGNAIEADSGIVILIKIQALVAMEQTLLDLLEGLVEVAQVVKATNIIIQVLIVMLQIIQVGRCRRGWDYERMESYYHTDV
jgi:hypothetical protein